ncbi:MAG: pyrimidine dimer DNA glycosylase/endonuclease V [Arthrobacter sp.]|uniref:pyrimidine dimer DNA glycosylase/endonuclease V n=1 Tax=unclassified Arthrobacter TaxID=235627 RepID=UPI00264D19C8|nr:pyrimidine dimer DNA glycosylase/endonuclease V [Micrococcaceae bacterium]MDN5811727.1 pyrimidine dimer DNA glycosylase/endonuclease V [Micrococcaceae bacterium]MDN5822938.1 pyrimidine dimer DNA glycosylase/endonuclease V [Micrococcaceae bacterium]MDN5878678.1 pyrimidine dimer DNA glycosylase/endonuclease V [Micrococcaceae bacterium]MDN5886202.1 pyrimidine dimer DNA glycosylase/endonuclease V [Micrococcaceae bacterium]
MRLWSLHPRYLDSKGLVACWRETLLAQKVLGGDTVGYRNHPQLTRFRAGGDPISLIGAYLEGLAAEADSRGYRFNRALVLVPHVPAGPLLTVTAGQLEHERDHLLAKLAVRAVELRGSVPTPPETHRLFSTIPGPIEPWEVP